MTAHFGSLEHELFDDHSLQRLQLLSPSFFHWSGFFCESDLFESAPKHFQTYHRLVLFFFSVIRALLPGFIELFEIVVDQPDAEQVVHANE